MLCSRRMRQANQLGGISWANANEQPNRRVAWSGWVSCKRLCFVVAVTCYTLYLLISLSKASVLSNSADSLTQRVETLESIYLDHVASSTVRCNNSEIWMGNNDASILMSRLIGSRYTVIYFH